MVGEEPSTTTWRRQRIHLMGVTSGMHLDCLLHRWGFWMQDPKQPITPECSADHVPPYVKQQMYVKTIERIRNFLVQSICVVWLIIHAFSGVLLQSNAIQCNRPTQNSSTVEGFSNVFLFLFSAFVERIKEVMIPLFVLLLHWIAWYWNVLLFLTPSTHPSIYLYRVQRDWLVLSGNICHTA